MNSILESNLNQEDKTILEIKNLDVIFELESYKLTSLREKFIKTIKNPIESLIGHKDSLHILKKINFTIKEGERVAILGVNGTGKTTLCRCITGMFAPTLGEINVNGEVRGIFDTTVGIIPELTGRENAYLLAKIMYPNLNPIEITQLVEESINFSELNEFADIPYKSYSKGMQTRLALPLISARPTDLLILDEVFDGADQFFQEKIANRVLKMIHHSGSVLFISHVPENIRKACNRAILLHKGEILMDGNPEDVLEKYNSLYE